jgi:hypothetical protein
VIHGFDSGERGERDLKVEGDRSLEFFKFIVQHVYIAQFLDCKIICHETMSYKLGSTTVPNAVILELIMSILNFIREPSSLTPLKGKA